MGPYLAAGQLTRTQPVRWVRCTPRWADPDRLVPSGSELRPRLEPQPRTTLGCGYRVGKAGRSLAGRSPSREPHASVSRGSRVLWSSHEHASTSSACAVRRDGHQIICSTSLQRRTCSMSAQPAQLADHGAGYRPCGRQAVLAMASFAARAQRSRRRGRSPRKPPMPALGFVSRILLPWAGRPK